MKAVHLISTEGPLLLFGGPYSNLEATQAMLREAARLSVPPHHVICTGDVVAYGADPAATVALVREAGWHVVMGNCEESLALGASDCGCGFPAGSTCERLSAAWYSHAVRQLSADALAWMAGLPRRLDIQIGSYRLAVVHGGVERINKFIFASTAAETKQEELAKASVDGVIGGHCGLPFTQPIGGKLWHNPGVIGMPANDGTTRAWYSLLFPRADGLAIEHHAISYDFRTAADKMRRASLPEEYAKALETGLWPNCDVLPWTEIRARGIALTEGDALWRTSEPPRHAPKRSAALTQLWPAAKLDSVPTLSPLKFKNPKITAAGEPRASVALQALKTLWFNTGTLCNITCRNCYIESSPRNDRLAYLSRDEVRSYLDEIERNGWQTEEIGFTGGEPFLNPDLLGMLEDCLSRNYRVLLLTNAMRPMQRHKGKLTDLKDRLGQKLHIRVSLDHFTAERHEDERGPGSFKPTLDGLIWLSQQGFNISVAGRTMWREDLNAERSGYAQLFAEHNIPVDAFDPSALVLFPEMEPTADVPEISDTCWNKLHKSPQDVMCASSRMIVKRKAAAHPVVLACTLIPYDEQFELGSTLTGATNSVPLNHPNCARFCVLGGASCSPTALTGT